MILLSLFLSLLTAQASSTCALTAVPNLGSDNEGNIQALQENLPGPCKNEPAFSVNKVKKIEDRLEADLYGDALMAAIGQNDLDDPTMCEEIWVCDKGDCSSEKDQKTYQGGNTLETGNWVVGKTNYSGQDKGFLGSQCVKYYDYGKACSEIVKAIASGKYNCKKRSTKTKANPKEKFSFTNKPDEVYENLALILESNYEGEEKENLLKQLGGFRDDLKQNDHVALSNLWHLQNLNKKLALEAKKLATSRPDLTAAEVKRMQTESMSQAMIYLLKTRQSDDKIILNCDPTVKSQQAANESAANITDGNIKKVSTAQLKSAETKLNKFLGNMGFEKSQGMLGDFSLDGENDSEEVVSVTEQEKDVLEEAGSVTKIPLYATAKVDLSYENGGKICPEDKLLFLDKINNGFKDNMFDELKPENQTQLNGQIQQVKAFLQEGHTIEKFRIKSSASTYRNTKAKYSNVCPEVLKYAQNIPEIFERCSNGQEWPKPDTAIDYDELSILRALEVKTEIMSQLTDAGGKPMIDPNLIELDWQGTNFIDCSTASAQIVRTHPLFESWKRNHQNKEPTCAQLAAYNGTSGPLSPFEDKQTTETKDSYEQYKYVQLQIFGKGKIPQTTGNKVIAKHKALASNMNCSATSKDPGTVDVFGNNGGGSGPPNKLKIPKPSGSNSAVSCPIW